MQKFIYHLPGIMMLAYGIFCFALLLWVAVCEYVKLFKALIKHFKK